jgi:hypothetical protein
MTYELARIDPLRYGFPTNGPLLAVDATARAVPTANTAQYFRWIGSGTISKIGIYVGNQSGNMSLALYARSGNGRSATPGTSHKMIAICCRWLPHGPVADVPLTAAICVQRPKSCRRKGPRSSTSARPSGCNVGYLARRSASKNRCPA